MALSISQTATGTDYEIIEEGIHKATCVKVIDVGSHPNPFNDGKLQRQVVIVWEFPEVLMELEKDGITSTVPRVMSKTFTLSLHEKSNLYKTLKGWRGKSFTPEELKCFDLFTVVGTGCQLQLVHEVSQKDGRTYANIGAIVPLPKADWITAERVQTYSIDDDGLAGVPVDCYPWIVDKLEASAEIMALREAGPAIDPAVDPLPF